MAAESIVKFNKPAAPAPIKAPTPPAPTQQTPIGTNMAGTTVNSGANAGYVLKGASSGPTSTTTPAATAVPKTTPILANPSSGTASTTTPATSSSGFGLSVPPPPTSPLEQHVTNTVDTAQAQLDAETQRQLQANYYDQYVKPYNDAKAQGLLSPNSTPPPATYQEYAQLQQGKTQQNINYTAGQNNIQRQLDQLGLTKLATQGGAAIAGTTAAMAQGREGVMGSSKPLVAQQFSKEQQAVIDDANLRVQAAQDQRDQAMLQLKQAQATGDTDMATHYQAMVDSANQQIQQNKINAAKAVTDANNTAISQTKDLAATGALNTATPQQLQDMATQYGIPLTVLQNAATTAAQTSMTANQKDQADIISSFTANAINLNSSGVPITPQMVQEYSQKTGVPAPYVQSVADGLSQTVQGIQAMKNLDPQIKQQALDQAKQNASDQLSGFNSVIGQQTRFLETIQKGINNHSIDPAFGQMLLTQGLVAMGKPDYADPATNAKLQYSQLQNQALQLQNQVDNGSAPYGSPAWVALQKTKLDMQALVANTYENTGVDITNAQPNMGDNYSKKYANTPSLPVAPFTIGGKAIQAQPIFGDALQKADADMFAATGSHIQIGENYRTKDQQEAIRKRFGYTSDTQPSGYNGLPMAAPPGTSFHERGLAVDVSNWKEATPFLEKYGIVGGLQGDMNHFSMGEMNPEIFSKDNGPTISPLGYTNPSMVPFKSASTTYQLPDSTQLGQPLSNLSNVGMPPSSGAKTYQDYINEAQAQGIVAPKDQKAYAMKQVDAQNAQQLKNGSVPNPTGAKRSINDIIYVSPSSGQQFSLSSWMGKSPSGYDYVDLSQAGDAKAMAQDTATQNGIASLTKDQVTALTNIDSTQQALDQIKTNIIPHLSDNNGAWNPITGTWANVENSYAAATNTDPDLKQYMDQQRIELMNTMRGIFTGMKINPSRLASVETALPNFTDNKASAEDKINRLKELLSNTERDLIKSNGGKLTQ